jgi:hypothetical protein
MVTCIRKYVSIGLAALAAWLLASDLLRPQGVHAQQIPDIAKQTTFRQVADEFIAAAASGDTARMGQLISPTIASRTGKEAMERYLAGDVRPFFADFKELGRSITVTGTQGVSGQTFYMYKVTRNNEYRPFMIQVIEEAGQGVVSNIVVDKFVEGRHCARVANGWKCPDFR